MRFDVVVGDMDAEKVVLECDRRLAREQGVNEDETRSEVDEMAMGDGADESAEEVTA